jgi:transposase
MTAAKSKGPGDVVKDIKRKTRRVFNAEEKIRIILEGLKAEESISSICRREQIHPTQYYKWSKEFLEAGKKRLNGDIVREATSPEVSELREENSQVKQLVAEVLMENRMLKKSVTGLE